MLPDTVNGLPLHPLSVHATVVLVPLAALLGIVFAIPRLREWARWPLALVALGAAAATFVSVQTGESFQEALGLGGAVAALVERHEELGKQLMFLVLAYAVVAVAAAGLVRSGARLPARSRSAGDPRADDDADQRSGGGALAAVFSVLLVVGAVAVGVQTYRVGEAGSEAVWNPTGDIDYSTD